jgi:site-specific DNA-cytosine methylase
VDNTKEFKHVSLCTGYGGIDIGLRRVIRGLRTIAYSEIEAYAVANLVQKIEAGHLDAAPIWPNLKTFPYADFYKKVDIISGGFPCQPFSTAGTRGGDSDPRHLWPYIKRGIELARPPLVFLENVQGLLSSKLRGTHWEDEEGTPVLLHIFRELERVGYKPTAGIFSACEVGAPHQRKRVFILAVSNELTREGYDKINSLIKPYESFTPYPAPRGCKQYKWEAPRVLAYSDSGGVQSKTTGEFTSEQMLKCNPQTTVKPSLGRTVNGFACGLGASDMLTSFDNRTDELRLLGNGVVPDTASKAFFELWQELGNTENK